MPNPNFVFMQNQNPFKKVLDGCFSSADHNLEDLMDRYEIPTRELAILHRLERINYREINNMSFKIYTEMLELAKEDSKINLKAIFRDAEHYRYAPMMDWESNPTFDESDENDPVTHIFCEFNRITSDVLDSLSFYLKTTPSQNMTTLDMFTCDLNTALKYFEPLITDQIIDPKLLARVLLGTNNKLIDIKKGCEVIFRYSYYKFYCKYSKPTFHSINYVQILIDNFTYFSSISNPENLRKNLSTIPRKYPY